MDMDWVWVIIHHALLISLWRLPWYSLFSYSGMGMVTLRGPVTSMGLSCMGITMISVSSARWISSIMICSFSLSPPRQFKSSSRVRSAPANLAIMVMMYSQPSLSHRSITASSLQSLMERTAPTASKTLVVELDRLVSYRIPARTVKRLFNCLVLRTLVVSWEIIAKPSRTKMGTRSVNPMFSRRWVPGEYLTPEWKQYQLVWGKQIFLEVTPGSTMGVTRTLGPRRNCVSAIQSMQVLESRGNSKKRGLQMVPSPLLATNCWYMYFRREQRSLMFLVADCRTVSPKAQGSCGMEPSSLWSLAKVQTAPNWNHLAQSSGLVFPPNPQMSGPTIWKPNICALKLSAIDPFRYSQLALLSPVQWKPNLLEPMVELRVMMKGRSPLYFRNWLVAQVSRKALKTCTSASERLPQWVALREMVCDSIWSAPGWQGRSLEQSYLYSPEGPEQAPSQKLANSFMSSQIPENLTLAQSLPSISSQQEVALGWKKSTKVVGPGQTRPTYGFWVLLSMMQTFRLRPSSQAGPEVLMPASMMGMYRYFSNILFSLSRGNLFSSMVKSSQSIMQSISVQMVSRGMPLLSQPEMTFQRWEMFLYPQRHWWKPKLQKGGRAALPLQRLSFQRVVQGFCSPRKNRKSMMPPITLKVRQCLPSETDLMTSMALELRRQLMWKRLFLSLSMQKGKQPQVCSPSPLSMTCPLSRLKTVHFPLPFLKVDWNLSPIPQMYSLSTSVPIQRQWSLQMTFWLQVEKRTAPFCLRMILKSKGEEVNSNETAELAMGKEKLPSGSMGKMPYWGTSYLLLLGSVILKEKSKKVWVRKVKRRVLMMGLLSLMKQLSDPVQFRVSWMVVLLRNQFTTLYSDLARTERERRVQMRRYLQRGCIHQI